MHAGKFELKPIEFTKEERCCAMVMIFVNYNMDIKTNKVVEVTGVPLRTIQKIKKLLCETRDPWLQEGVPGRRQKGQNP